MLSRVLALVVVWGAATAFDIAVARWTRIGPVLVSLGRGHGVHVGDLAALAATVVVALLVSVLILRRA